LKIGVVVTVVYVAVAYGAEFITGHTESWHAVGVTDAWLDLTSGALNQIAKGIATVALTIGLAIPSLQGKAVVKKENQDHDHQA
jgi:hypothetical protein